MAEYFDICGTHIPMASIKDFRTIKVEFVFRPVFRESKKSMMTALRKLSSSLQLSTTTISK